MRLFAASLAMAAVLAASIAPALAGPGCSGYKAAKVTYPATALEPAAPQTPIPTSRTGG
jgi:hypothetical protein